VQLLLRHLSDARPQPGLADSVERRIIEQAECLFKLPFKVFFGVHKVRVNIFKALRVAVSPGFTLLLDARVVDHLFALKSLLVQFKESHCSASVCH
jgi:hypothetical protein